jgi:hypothetical protein
VPTALAASTALAGEEQNKAGQVEQSEKTIIRAARDRAEQKVGPDPSLTLKRFPGETKQDYARRKEEKNTQWLADIKAEVDKDPQLTQRDKNKAMKELSAVPYATKYPTEAAEWMLGGMAMAGGLPVASRLGHLANMGLNNRKVRNQIAEFKKAGDRAGAEGYITEILPKIRKREAEFEHDPLPKGASIWDRAQRMGRAAAEPGMGFLDAALIAGVPYERDLRAPEGTEAYNQAWQTIDPRNADFWTRMGAPGIGGAALGMFTDRLGRAFLNPVPTGAAFANAALKSAKARSRSGDAWDVKARQKAEKDIAKRATGRDIPPEIPDIPPALKRGSPP